jgi:hypothetical protein
MTISRSQMPRQLRMGGGIMQVAPREKAFLGGLKKAFKGITKGIGSFLKSDIGKLALTAGSLYGLGGGSGLGSFFGKGSFNPLLRKVGGDFAQSQFGSLLSGAKNFLGSNVGKLVAGATAGKLFGDMEPQQIQALKGDPEALRQYLEQYYDNLNLPSVDTNDPNAMAAYDTKKENFLNRNMKAGGGRMGYDDGTPDPTYTGNNMEDLPRGLQIDTTTSNPIPNDAPQKEVSEVAKIMLGPGRSGIGEPEDGTMKGYQFFRTQYLPKKVTEIAENYGMKESEVLTMIREEMMKYIDAPESLEKPKMAYGGRINRAYGSDELVEQASGIEGLDININPKGVKELDLRETGGFIPPVGVKEKADDIPAMLSNNEFVFTADAVRAAGGGSVNKGAQIMYDTMKKLENGGTV